ncbi:lactate dehydrogenase [Mucilaginibacter sp. UYCu711]|jgi:D-lactate dehydrogenase|uniref:lactate dehydrogenase n=1 Tax=Mucilaginibacter sp. UYCu711 TaxID=3156339 RepID=UPI003D1A0922
MKVIAYNIKTFEKAGLADANQRKHHITLISNPIGEETVAYAVGKDAIIVSGNDDVSAAIISKLADMGIRYITTRSVGIDHIDAVAAFKRKIKIANVSLTKIAEQTIRNLDSWQLEKNSATAAVTTTKDRVAVNRSFPAKINLKAALQEHE